MINDVPRVSVLMVTYNSEKFITDSIVSILNQTYRDFELIICDDLSTDQTWETICRVKDPRIRNYRNENNLGEYANRNKAISLARGEWIIFIDGDDILYEFGLEVMLAHATKHPECGMVICRPWDERIIYPVIITQKQFYQFEYLDRSILGINFTKLLMKRNAVIEVGCFDDLNIRMGDAYIQYKIAMHFPSLIIQDGFSWWRRRKGQASENLIQNNHLFFIDHYKYALALLKDENNPLSAHETRTAFYNLYGNYIRLMIKKLFQFRISPFILLLKAHSIPPKYAGSVFIPQQRNFFGNYSGENPLR